MQVRSTRCCRAASYNISPDVQWGPQAAPRPRLVSVGRRSRREESACSRFCVGVLPTRLEILAL